MSQVPHPEHEPIPAQQPPALPPGAEGQSRGLIKRFINNHPRALAGIVAAGIGFGGSGALKVADPPEALASPASPDVISPGVLSQQATNLVTANVVAWSKHQTANGDYIDPRTGSKATEYGEAMLADATTRIGASTGNTSLVDSGIRGLFAHTRQPDNAGANHGFEIFGISEALAWNDKVLAQYPGWVNTRGAIVKFLEERSQRKPEGIVGKAFESDIYTNLRLVQALANIELNAAGIQTVSSAKAGAQAASENGTTVATANSSLLSRAASNTSKSAKQLGKMKFNGAGILSDPDHNPLAYNSLSAMLLGRIIQEQGYENTPSNIRSAFERTTKGIVGLMAPNGDVSYIGRGQGQVWTLAATADAMAMAARYEQNPKWRGRFLSAYDRSISALNTDYEIGSFGMPVIPDHEGSTKPSYKGLERYVSTVGYNGLAMNALLNSIEALKKTQPAANEGIASDRNGVFIDPDQTQFASVRKGKLWYAVHGTTSSIDGRYGFGVVAAQRIGNDGLARNAMPHRPYAKSERASGGPIIRNGRKTYVPTAQSMRANSAGTVSVVGGWSDKPGRSPSLDRNTTFTFKPKTSGVDLSFRTRKGRGYEFAAWAAKGAKVAKNSRGITITEKDGDRVKYSFNRAVKIGRLATNDASSYDHGMRRYVIRVAGNGRKLKEEISFSNLK